MSHRWWAMSHMWWAMSQGGGLCHTSEDMDSERAEERYFHQVSGGERRNNKFPRS